MHRYFVETEHTAEDCALVIGEVHAMGFLHHYDWGCDAGVHCGWAFIEGESEDQVLLTVPLMVRALARAVRVIQYTEADFKRTHAS